MNRKHVIGYAATALVALGLGAAGGSGDGTAPASATQGVTVTQTEPGPEVTVQGPIVTETATVTVPGPKTTVTVGPPAPKVTFPGDGTYQVGVDIKPGTYVSKAPDNNCYWARLSGSSGFDSIIDNNNSSGQSVVTIRKTDKFFETSGCSDWTKR